MEFTLRPYREETDFEAFYAFQHDFESKTVAYQLSGASPHVPKEEFREMLRRRDTYSGFHVVADTADRAIGVVYVGQYYRIGRHKTFQLTLWERPELTGPLLRHTLDEIFSFPAVRMAICKVNGCETDLLSACRAAGMEQAGCIPDYFCYEGTAYPEYTFILRHQEIKEGSGLPRPS